MKKSIYVIGSLKNPQVPELGNYLRNAGFEIFDDWYGAGPTADQCWQEYEQGRGRTYKEALDGYASRHIVQFDHTHLKRCDGAVLILPAGRSGHMELGFVLGQGKPGFILFDQEQDKWDQMYGLTFFSGGNVTYSKEELRNLLNQQSVWHEQR